MLPKSTCSTDGCERTHEARGMCKVHYAHWRQAQPRDSQACRIDGCTRDTFPRVGICGLHYFRIRNGTPIDAPLPLPPILGTKCAIGGCGKQRTGKYCRMHYARIERHGYPDTVIPAEDRRCRSGPENRKWLPDDAMNYAGPHNRQKTKASHCSQCGLNDAARRYQWALNWVAQPYARCRLVGERAPFSPRSEDYIEMCIPCHKAMDLQVIREWRA